ncbi:MAG: hypothetical protein ACI9VX_002443, partial [Dinoroseobacter sp.]
MRPFYFAEWNGSEAQEARNLDADRIRPEDHRE